MVPISDIQGDSLKFVHTCETIIMIKIIKIFVLFKHLSLVLLMGAGAVWVFSWYEECCYEHL